VDNQMRANSPSLRQSGQGLSETADRLLSEWQRLQADVQGMGDPFGDDMVGGLIGASYSAAQEAAGETYQSAAGHLQDFGAGLGTMADLYDETEQANTTGFDDIGRQL
jgi:uncharacterized protein YukE